jgi:CubicO group peptidase (beta-lactamase class C family)
MSNSEVHVSEQVDYSLAFATKLLASGIFVGGRDPQHFIDNDLHAPYGFDPQDLDVDIDRAEGRVTLTLPNGHSRTAVFNPGLGCTLIPRGESSIFFEPVKVEVSLPEADSVEWPMGNLNATHTPGTVNRTELEAALDDAFDDNAHDQPQRARAMVVLHKGRIVGERYAPGFNQDSKLVSWSMGKSITSALIGILMGDGHFEIDDPAPVAPWREPGDPRGDITMTHLLRMSSGLKFERIEDDADPAHFTSENDHNYIYFGAVNVFEHSISRPQEFPPDTVWRYRNCDPLTLGMIVKQTVEARGEEYLAYPQRALFDRIGIRDIVLEPDPWGNFVNTGFDHGTARDWARFGLLHLQDGVWQGERILPAGWVDFVRTPAPADPERHYGGQFWLNAGGNYADIPRDAFWAAGARGQTTMIIPSRDVVIVRLGHSLDSESHGRYLNRIVGRVLGAIKPTS